MLQGLRLGLSDADLQRFFDEKGLNETHLVDYRLLLIEFGFGVLPEGTSKAASAANLTPYVTCMPTASTKQQASPATNQQEPINDAPLPTSKRPSSLVNEEDPKHQSTDGLSTVQRIETLPSHQISPSPTVVVNKYSTNSFKTNENTTTAVSAAAATQPQRSSNVSSSNDPNESEMYSDPSSAFVNVESEVQNEDLRARIQALEEKLKESELDRQEMAERMEFLEIELSESSEAADRDRELLQKHIAEGELAAKGAEKQHRKTGAALVGERMRRIFEEKCRNQIIYRFGMWRIISVEGKAKHTVGAVLAKVNRASYLTLTPHSYPSLLPLDPILTINPDFRPMSRIKRSFQD